MSRPRIRSIKPEMWQDEKIGELSRDARLLFIGLVTMADDEGRLRALSPAILGHIFPYDEDAVSKLKRWMREVIDSGLVIAYKVGGVPYLQLTGWRKHQVINKPNSSELPPPPLPDNYGNGTGELPAEVVQPHAGAQIGRERKGTPLPPEGEKRVTFDRKPVPPARLALAERILTEFNRQADTSYGAFTGRGRPSEDLKRIIGALTDAVPPLEFEEAREAIRLALANPKPYWDGKPHTGVVFGPKVIGNLREQAKRQQPRAEGAWSRGFVQAVTGEAA